MQCHADGQYKRKLGTRMEVDVNKVRWVDALDHAHLALQQQSSEFGDGRAILPTAALRQEGSSPSASCILWFASTTTFIAFGPGRLDGDSVVAGMFRGGGSIQQWRRFLCSR